MKLPLIAVVVALLWWLPGPDRVCVPIGERVHCLQVKACDWTRPFSTLASWWEGSCR